jgi:hypothetical protein
MLRRGWRFLKYLSGASTSSSGNRMASSDLESAPPTPKRNDINFTNRHLPPKTSIALLLQEIVVFGYALITTLLCLFSGLFHWRDTPLSEQLDYFFANLSLSVMLLIGVLYASVEVLGTGRSSDGGSGTGSGNFGKYGNRLNEFQEQELAVMGGGNHNINGIDGNHNGVNRNTERRNISKEATHNAPPDSDSNSPTLRRRQRGQSDDFNTNDIEDSEDLKKHHDSENKPTTFRGVNTVRLVLPQNRLAKAFISLFNKEPVFPLPLAPFSEIISLPNFWKFTFLFGFAVLLIFGHYAYHIYRMLYEDFDYGRNMETAITIAVFGSIIWISLMVRKTALFRGYYPGYYPADERGPGGSSLDGLNPPPSSTPPPKSLIQAERARFFSETLFVILGPYPFLICFELLDFSPWWGLLDAHSLWHMALTPLHLYWYNIFYNARVCILGVD